jgi:hypothetical protein
MQNNKSSWKQKEAPWEAVDFLKTVSAISEPDLDLAMSAHEPPHASVDESVVAVEPAIDENRLRSDEHKPRSDIPTMTNDLRKKKLAVEEPTKALIDYSSKDTKLMSQPTTKPSVPVISFPRSVVMPKNRAGSHIIEVKQDAKPLEKKMDLDPETKQDKSLDNKASAEKLQFFLMLDISSFRLCILYLVLGVKQWTILGDQSLCKR